MAIEQRNEVQTSERSRTRGPGVRVLMAIGVSGLVMLVGHCASTTDPATNESESDASRVDDSGGGKTKPEGGGAVDASPTPDGGDTSADAEADGSSPADSGTCNPGSYLNGATCTLCPQNTYSSTTNASSCTACPAGTTSPAGATSCTSTAGGELSATTASMTGAGLNDCGTSSSDVCARSLLVTGGTFNRGEGTSSPATVSDFRLDKYEVTVGRFRKFVDAWVGGWRPSAGSGKHTHVNSGQGLASSTGGFEPGWNAAWTSYVGAAYTFATIPTGPGATTKANWDASLLDCATTTWTSAPGANEKRPQNCLSWYDLHAFCIWDGGFLPSEAEWEYSAAGGSDERMFPWGTSVPGANISLAVYECRYSGTSSCDGLSDIAPVGSAPNGAARYGQLDLAGNVWEWNLDWYQSSYFAPCTNCSNLTSSSTRLIRGGSFLDGFTYLKAANRIWREPALRWVNFGGRCARTP